MDSRFRGNDVGTVRQRQSFSRHARANGHPGVEGLTARPLMRSSPGRLPMDSRFRGNDGNRVGGYYAMQNELAEQVRALDAATRLRRTFDRQVAANLKELGCGG